MVDEPVDFKIVFRALPATVEEEEEYE